MSEYDVGRYRIKRHPFAARGVYVLQEWRHGWHLVAEIVGARKAFARLRALMGAKA